MLAITGTKFFMSLALLSTMIILLILVLRSYMRHRGQQLASTPTPSYRQYAAVNVFRFTPTLFRVGMVAALLVTFFAFNWTTYERTPITEEILVVEIDEIDQHISHSIPPPPPPKIVEIPDEMEIEAPELIDQTFEETEVIEEFVPPPPPKPVPVVVPPPPPPPPVVKKEEEIPDIVLISEQMPRFPGCETMEGTEEEKRKCAEKTMLQYLYSKIKYPTVARENNIEGMVVVSFVVEKDGSVTNPKILRDLEGGCGKEALRVVREMPRWTPGYMRTRPVRVQMNLPVRFQLEN